MKYNANLMGLIAIALALICLFLPGCAPAVFVKPGQIIYSEQFQKDSYECHQQAGAGSMDNVFIARDLLYDCMKARGYVQQ